MIARAFEPDRDEPAARELRTAGQAGCGTRRELLSKRARSVLSLLLILHLVAIASAPLAMEPASLPAQKVFAFFRPYLDAAFLNHGYHFFAPEPGPSHLIRYELTLADGRTESGIFPDPAEQRPRLNYHRHFMLSEFANQLAVDESRQAALHELSQSFARHLMSRWNAESATLFLRRHYIPSPQQVQTGTLLDAEELYAERPLGTFWLAGDSSTIDATSAVGAVRSESQGSRPVEQLPAAARLTGQLRLPGDLRAREVIR